MSVNILEINRSLRDLANAADRLEKRHKSISDAMTQLQEQGLIYATLYYRDDKYLYLNYPLTDGPRRREYVGCDPQKIEEAKAGVDRGQRFDALSRELKEVQNQMESMGFYLQQAARAAA